MCGTESFQIVFVLPAAWRFVILCRSAAYLNFLRIFGDTTEEIDEGLVADLTIFHEFLRLFSFQNENDCEWRCWRETPLIHLKALPSC